METILVKSIKTGHISSQSYQDKQDAVKAKKWYLSLKENGAKKYSVTTKKQVK
jgi:hypothetical protein